jgi:dipeptidyl aminopeptidase/acylaminoacyl peptidase
LRIGQLQPKLRSFDYLKPGDRIAWIRAAAAAHPEMDLSRVGIYGGSAGGQNALPRIIH